VITDPSLASPRLNATRFREAHEADWERLDGLVARIERRSVRALSSDELIALPLLYRQTLSALSTARETSLDRAMVQYLEELCARAYFQIYGVRVNVARQLGQFFARDWADAVRGLWRETIIATALLIVGIATGYLLVRHDQTWFYDLIPQAFSDGRNPGASAETLRAGLYQSKQDLLTTFAAFLFTHNSQMAIFAFSLGFAFGVPTALLLIYNGVIAGAFFAVYVPKGLGVAFGGWLLIHGTTELFAITLAGAAGFRIGSAIAFPGRANRVDAAVIAGRSSAIVMAGVVVMLAAAGLLEGIGRQTITADGERYAIAAAMLAAWLLYFYIPRGRNALGA
jgi:uncharacterized membrane protein SpoIIM required for sporulation